MEVILHVGAHRTATTTFQAYLRDNATTLAERGILAWEPRTTRKGLLAGIVPAPGAQGPGAPPGRARARVEARLDALAQTGARHLVISDENMIGSPRHNRRHGALYPDIAARMTRFFEAFGHRIANVVLSIRPQDEFWSSVLIYSVMRGHAVPGRDELAALALGGHAWRDVVTALAGAVPGADIRVLPHHPYAGRPDLRLARMTNRPGLGAPMLPPALRAAPLNASAELPRLRQLAAMRGAGDVHLPRGEGRWSPFDLQQLCHLRELYCRDIAWLRGGADGLATWIEETGDRGNRAEETGRDPAAALATRGQANGIEERRLA